MASLPIVAWLLLLQHYYPTLFTNWWQMNLNNFNQYNHLYFARILFWYAWPALPLAMLGLWHYRQQLLIKPKFQLMLVFFICSLFLLGVGARYK